MESGPFVGVGAEAGDLAGMGKREELKGAAADDEGVKSAVGGGGLAIIGEAGLGAEVGGKGVLRKAKVPGGVRCSGVLASDLEKLLAAMARREDEGVVLQD